MPLPFIIPIANMVSQLGTNIANRSAQIAENQKNRDWQERIYKQYESPQAQVQQMAAAGVNPYSQGNISPQQVGSASTSSLPAGVAPSFDMPLYPTLQKEQMEANIEQTKTETAKTWKDNVRADLELDLMKTDVTSRLNLVSKEIEQLDVLIQQGKIDKASKQQYLDWLLDVAGFGYNPVFSHAEMSHINTVIANLNLQYKDATKDTLIKHVEEGLRHAYAINNLEEEAQDLKNQMSQRNFDLTNYRDRFNKMFGYDPSILPPSLQGYVLGRLFNFHLRPDYEKGYSDFDNWKAVGKEIQYQCEGLLDAASFIYNPETTTTNYGASAFSVGFNYGSSTTQNNR